MNDLNYWKEGISDAAEECSLKFTEEQLTVLAKAVSGGHDHYGQAFYSPPSSDRYAEIERDWQAKFDKLQAEFDLYRGYAETAVKQALRIHSDEQIGIGKYGEVTKYGGRIERIQ